MYDYIHHELQKEKCDGFQMPTPEALAEWFVSELVDKNLKWQNFHIIRRIMDFYTLLRMFRKFAPPAKRCIVYAGASHSRALEKLLVDTQGYIVLDKYDPESAYKAAQAGRLSLSQSIVENTQLSEQDLKEEYHQSLSCHQLEI